jgi:D-glucosaminate-6-phosphate ammonia-lyase
VKSQHTWAIQQNGNWLNGSHKADFSARDVSGTLDGDQFKLISLGTRPGVTFIFYGTVTGDTISGQINMGDYLDAKFTAKKHVYPGTRNPVVIPKTRLMSS